MNRPVKHIQFFLLLMLLSFAVQAQVADDQATDSVTFFKEEMPEFPGGLAARNKFISDNIRYPKPALKQGIVGKCTITFLIDSSGKLSDFKQTGPKLGWGLDEEAMRVIKMMPKWLPGKQNGKPVPVRYTLPIAFNLSKNKSK